MSIVNEDDDDDDDDDDDSMSCRRGLGGNTNDETPVSLRGVSEDASMVFRTPSSNCNFGGGGGGSGGGKNVALFGGR